MLEKAQLVAQIKAEVEQGRALSFTLPEGGAVDIRGERRRGRLTRVVVRVYNRDGTPGERGGSQSPA